MNTYYCYFIFLMFCYLELPPKFCVKKLCVVGPLWVVCQQPRAGPSGVLPTLAESYEGVCDWRVLVLSLVSPNPIARIHHPFTYLTVGNGLASVLLVLLPTTSTKIKIKQWQDGWALGYVYNTRLL